MTVIDLKPAVITQVKTKEKNGYQAIQVGFLEKKAKAANKPEQGHAKASGAAGLLSLSRIPSRRRATSSTV